MEVQQCTELTGTNCLFGLSLFFSLDVAAFLRINHTIYAGNSSELPGDNSGGATPVPIPNTEVKTSSADGTAGESRWESRSSPGIISADAPSSSLDGAFVVLSCRGSRPCSGPRFRGPILDPRLGEVQPGVEWWSALGRDALELIDLTDERGERTGHSVAGLAVRGRRVVVELGRQPCLEGAEAGPYVAKVAVGPFRLESRGSLLAVAGSFACLQRPRRRRAS